MRKFLPLGLLALVAGCDSDTPLRSRQVTVEQVELALQICQPNGGLHAVSNIAVCRVRGCRWEYFVEATCVNGAVFTKRVSG